MPTASIYYRNDDPFALDFLLLDGIDAPLIPQRGEDNLTTVTHALANLTAAGRTGWQPTRDARIVRQADGRATITVEPAPAPLTLATVYINATPADNPYRIAVDGRTLTFTTGYRLAANVTDTQHLGVATIDRHLRDLGYVRTSDIVKDTQANGAKGSLWTCTARADEQPIVTVHVDADHRPVLVMVGQRSIEIGEKVNAGILTHGQVHEQAARTTVDAALDAMGFARTDKLIYNEHLSVYRAPVQPVREWTDEPTVVRINDDAARNLADVASRLGIPTDVLASTWILSAAADAIRRQDRFLEPGYIVDHTRITGWIHDGSPTMKDW